jgi:sulfonate transport system permease protein
MRAAAPPAWLGWLPPLALLALWQAAGSAGLIDATLWATPATVWQAARDAVGDGSLQTDLLASLRRDVAGLALGVPAGLALGTLLGLSPGADRFFGPTLSGIRQVALFSWVPLISLWLGNDDPAKISFVAFAVFFPVMLASQAGVRGAEIKLVEVGRTLCLTRAQMLRRIILPAALPQIAAGIHLALVIAWLATIGAEYLFSAGPGIGSALMTGRAMFRMDQVIAAMLSIAAVGLGLNLIAGAAERRLLRARGL